MAFLPQFTSCFYIFSLRTASLIVGWLSVVVLSLGLIEKGMSLSRSWMHIDLRRIFDAVEFYFLSLLLFIFVGYFLRGVMKRKPEHMIPFMVVWVFFISYILVQLVLSNIVSWIEYIINPAHHYPVSVSDIEEIILYFILLVFNVYMLLVVKSHYNELVAASPRPVVQYVAAKEKQGKKGDATSSAPHEIEAKINLLQEVEYGYN